MKQRLIILSAVTLIFISIGATSANRFLVDTLALALIFATFATAWNFAGGMTGLFSLGHGGLFAVGAYVPALLKEHFNIPTIAGIGIAAVAATLFALIIGAMSLRLRGHYFALATLAFTVVVTIFLTNMGPITGGDEGMSLPFENNAWELVFENKESYLYLAMGLYFIAAITAIILLDSKIGYRMRALREDEVTARSMGVPALQTKLIAIIISGFFSGLAGSIYAQYTLYVTPENTSAVTVSLQPALMAIIGGMIGVFGPLIGAMLITLLEQQLITVFGANMPGLADAFFGGLLLISILILPNGIVSIFKFGAIRKIGTYANRIMRPRQKLQEEENTAKAKEHETVGS